MRSTDEDGNSPDSILQPSVSALATNFVQLAGQGWTTYLVPHFTWEKTWDDDKGLQAADLTKLGRVEEPDGTQPTLPGTRNWILSDASSTQTGELYRNRLEWTASEDGNWQADIYNY